MARGFDSKFVESQQDDAQQTTSARRPLTAEEVARLERRRTLEMALTSAQAELQAACRPAHRDMVRLKLEALQAELGTL
jgi:predicted outer membrane protein